MSRIASPAELKKNCVRNLLVYVNCICMPVLVLKRVYDVAFSHHLRYPAVNYIRVMPKQAGGRIAEGKRLYTYI